jgi:hypothetical protein
MERGTSRVRESVKRKNSERQRNLSRYASTYIGKWRTWVDKNEGRAGHGVVRDNVESFVDADIVIRGEKINAYKADKKSLAQAVPPSAFKDDGTVDITLLSGAVVYYNPISKEWFTVSNAGTESAEPIVVESYIDGWNNIDQDTSSDSSQKTVDELSETDETIKTKKQAKKFEDVDYSQYTAKDFMPTSGPDVIEESIKTADKTGKDVTDFWKWVASPKGVALQNKNTDQAATELDQLKGWWNDQAWNKDEG